MKTLITTLAFFSCVCSLSSSGYAQKERLLTVIVNASTNINSLNKAELDNVLRGKDNRFSAIALQAQYYDAILENYVSMSSGDFQRSWLKLVSSGRRKKEPLLSKDAHSLIAFVARNRNVLAVLSWQDVNRPPDAFGVRALRVYKDGQLLNPETHAHLASLKQPAEETSTSGGRAQSQTLAADSNLYQKAVRTQESGDLQQAKLLFEQLRIRRPGFKDVEKRLAEIYVAAQMTDQKQEVESLYEQARQHEAKGNYTMAVETYATILQKWPNYEDATTRLAKARQRVKSGQRWRKLKSNYARGIAALRAQNWERAVAAFEDVVELDLSYKDALSRLEEAEAGLVRASSQSRVNQYYEAAIESMRNNNLPAALSELEVVRKIEPGFRDTENLIAQLQSDIQSERSARKASKAAFLDSLYQEALTAMANEEWQQSEQLLKHVQEVHPNYRNSIENLILTRQRLNSLTTANDGLPNPRTIFYVGSVVIVLVPFCLVVFSPMMRARIFMITGNLFRAMQIYERILLKNPHRVALYTKLAHIYLLLNKRDEQALRVFIMVLKLNLITPHIDRIHSIVAQNYLQDGAVPKDPDAIKVLENELQKQRAKLKKE
ncbi:MAG: tetratricopeptide repeat protein [bacterium]